MPLMSNTKGKKGNMSVNNAALYRTKIIGKSKLIVLLLVMIALAKSLYWSFWVIAKNMMRRTKFHPMYLAFLVALVSCFLHLVKAATVFCKSIWIARLDGHRIIYATEDNHVVMYCGGRKLKLSGYKFVPMQTHAGSADVEIDLWRKHIQIAELKKV